MANNFRRTGSGYVSKIGSNSNSGLTADLPKLTITGAAALGGSSSTIVLGSGLYYEALSSFDRGLIGDGFVKLLGTGANTLGLLNPITGTFTYDNLNIESYALVSISGTNNPIANFSNCVFNTITNFTYGVSGAFLNFNKCIFINVSFGTLASRMFFTECIFINCTFTVGAGGITSCYSDAATTLFMFSTISSFNYNNIEGGIKMTNASSVTAGVIQDTLGKYYDLSVAGSGGSGAIGTPYQRGNTANATFALAAHKIAYTTYNVNSIASAPLFNNVSILDFTLQSTSPHIVAGSGGVNIGGTNYAFALYPNVTNELLVANGAVISNLSGTNDLTISVGQTSGYIESAPFRYGLAITELGKIRYVGAIYHDKSASGGTAGRNDNVPDSAVFGTSDVTGASNPDRLILEYRFSTSATMPATGTDYDNGGFSSAGTWNKCPWMEKPVFDNLGRDNGNPAYNTASVLPVGATWMQIKITLTKNYVN